MSQTWDPDVYLRYEAYRARPALDLIAQIPLEIDGPVTDLGCGPGNVTQRLKERWPDRTVTGVDLSALMLDKARTAYGESGIAFEEGDIASWRASEPQALIFSNAALHWVQGLDAVIPALAGMVKPRGWLAFQIPVTFDSPYQQCLRATVQSERWTSQLTGVWMYKDPPRPEETYDLLSSSCAIVDIWETDYHHVLEGDNPVLDWITGTGLTPYLSVLNTADQEAFIEDYGTRILDAYPKQADGKTLFLMKRIFALAQRR